MPEQREIQTDSMEQEPQTEAEWAAYYQAHKDDFDDGEIIPSPIKRRPGRPSTGLSATIAVRFTPEEAEIIYGLAHDRGSTLSEVVREAVRSLATHCP